MKNKIIIKFGRIFGVIGMITVLCGAVFAQTQTRKIYEISRTFAEQTPFNIENSNGNVFFTEAAGEATSGKLITAANKAGFNIATQFVLVKFDVSLLENNAEVRNLAIAALVYLIDDLEGQPEAAALGNTLKSVVRKTGDSAQSVAQIESASKSYSSRLPNEQKWYFDAGAAVTNLMIGAYMSDNTRIKNNLSEIQNLIKIAPQGTSAALLTPMRDLAKYAAYENFADKDYNALMEGAIGITNLLKA